MLLITQFAGDDLMGGAAIIRYWISRIAEADVFWISLSRDSGLVPNELAHVKRRESCYLRMRGNTWPGVRQFWRWFGRVIWSGHIAGCVRRRIDEFDPDVVWVVFDYGLAPLLARIGPHLKRRRTHVSLHDEPCATAQRESLGRAFLREIETAKTQLQQTMVSYDAVSEELAASMLNDPSSAILVTLPVNPLSCARQFRTPKKQGVFRIGFSGNFWGQRELEFFVTSLNSWSTRTARDWELITYGDSRLAELSPKVRAFGPTLPAQVREGLDSCDAFLLPLPIGRPEMMTSLPTKLVTYAELGRPIFTIAPRGSATERVVRSYHLGPTVSALDGTSMIEGLDRLLEWGTEQAAAGWAELISNRFSHARIASQLGTTLDISFQ
ncbi:MAG TPA: hypothetical protein VH684_14630 [Xanthobacteraceae bacterium]